jgi:hypothetical protein
MTKVTVAFAPARLNNDEELCQETALRPLLRRLASFFATAGSDSLAQAFQKSKNIHYI